MPTNKASTQTIIVFFNLKPGVNESDYLAWAKNTDLPTVKQLSSVSSFDVYKGLNMLGEDKAPTWQYFEMINIQSQESFVAEIQNDVMKKVVEQFQAFAQDAHFIVTQNIATI